MTENQILSLFAPRLIRQLLFFSLIFTTNNHNFFSGKSQYSVAPSTAFHPKPHESFWLLFWRVQAILWEQLSERVLASVVCRQGRRTRACQACHGMPWCWDTKVVGTPISSRKKKERREKEEEEAEKEGGKLKEKEKKKKERRKEKNEMQTKRERERERERERII